MEKPLDVQIVYFGNDWFAENRTSSHHIARRLGERFPLLYVEVPGLRMPEATGRDLRKLLRKLKVAFRPPQQIGPHLWHMSLPQVPLQRFALVRFFNRQFSLMRLRRAIRRLRFRNVASWFVVPHPGALAGELGEKFVVYYCIDDYAALPGVDRSAVKSMDEALTRRADLVFAASPLLAKSKSELNQSVVFSPHGVDTELFAAAADTSRPAASAAPQLAHPIVGFFGVLDRRVDLRLVEYLAQSRPDWSFLLVGRIAAPVQAVANLRNVHLPGPVRYDDLPNWARAFDAAIMPYVQDEFFASSNPLKLREYLACGKPVVSFSTAEVVRFGHVVEIAHDYTEFLAAIERALATDSREKAQARMAAVASFTWDARVDEIVAKVSEKMRLRADEQGRSAAVRP